MRNHSQLEAAIEVVESLIEIALIKATTGFSGWANDLATSTPTHQWVSGISGANGTGATCTLRTDLSLVQAQGGTPAAPNPMRVLLLQPQPDPGGTTKSTFELNLRETLSNSTNNAVLGLGYNMYGVDRPDLPEVGISIEQDFEIVPGTHFTEAHIFHNGSVNSGEESTRVFTSIRNNQNGQVFSGVAYRGGQFQIVGGPVGGAPVIQVQFTDGSMQCTPAGYAIQGADALQVIGQTNLNLTATTSFMQLSCLGAGQTMAFNADAWAYRSHAGAQVALADSTVSGYRLYPNTDNTGSIGLGTNRWALIRGTVITSGDLELVDEERNAHWTLREEPDCLLAVNRVTDEWYEIPMVPLTPAKKAKYSKTPLKGATIQAMAQERAKEIERQNARELELQKSEHSEPS